MTTTVYLIRHAEAEGNVYRRCHGQYDSLLTPQGEQQLPFLAKRFADVPLDAIYSSDLYRARKTAQAIAKEKGMRVETRKALREINMGDWEDRPWAELPRLYPQKYAEWESRPGDCVVPGGESVSEAGTRMMNGLRSIVKRHDGDTVAVVSHGSAIRGALCIANGWSHEDLLEIGWGDNTCVAKLEFDGPEKVTVEYANDASHLPDSLSTFRSIGWNDQRKMPTSPQIWFKPVNLQNEAERETLIVFAREIYKNAYGTDEKLDRKEYLRISENAQHRAPNAVTFGMMDETPAALVMMNVCDLSDQQVGMVGGFCIEPEYRGCGLSPQILGQAISVYRALGREYLCANVGANNIRAQRFYLKNGFVRHGEMTNECGLHYRMVKRIKVDDR